MAVNISIRIGLEIQIKKSKKKIILKENMNIYSK